MPRKTGEERNKTYQAKFDPKVKKEIARLQKATRRSRKRRAAGLADGERKTNPCANCGLYGHYPKGCAAATAKAEAQAIARRMGATEATVAKLTKRHVRILTTAEPVSPVTDHNLAGFRDSPSWSSPEPMVPPTPRSALEESYSLTPKYVRDGRLALLRAEWLKSPKSLEFSSDDEPTTPARPDGHTRFALTVHAGSANRGAQPRPLKNDRGHPIITAPSASPPPASPPPASTRRAITETAERERDLDVGVRVGVIMESPEQKPADRKRMKKTPHVRCYPSRKRPRARCTILPEHDQLDPARLKQMRPPPSLDLRANAPRNPLVVVTKKATKRKAAPRSGAARAAAAVAAARSTAARGAPDEELAVGRKGPDSPRWAKLKTTDQFDHLLVDSD